MYLIDFDIFLRQYLPPTWRNSWQETLLSVLLHPLKEVHTAFRQQTRLRLQQTATNMQLLSLQSALIEMANEFVSVEQRSSDPFTFFVRVSKKVRKRDGKRIEAYLEQHKLAGTAYETEVINK